MGAYSDVAGRLKVERLEGPKVEGWKVGRLKVEGWKVERLEGWLGIRLLRGTDFRTFGLFGLPINFLLQI